MEKEFVPYELAVKLKELGFDEECFGYYTELEDFVMRPHLRQQDCIEGKFLAPTWQSAFRWFREKYEIEATTSCFYSKRLDIPYEERQYHCHVIRNGLTSKGPRYKTYEEAELACLDKLIELAKNK